MIVKRDVMNPTYAAFLTKESRYTAHIVVTAATAKLDNNPTIPNLPMEEILLLLNVYIKNIRGLDF